MDDPTYNASMVQALQRPGPQRPPAPESPEEEANEGSPVGLVQNAEGVPFQCGTCGYFEDGVCHNENPELQGREVQPEWCCNLYEHEGMETIVK